MLKNESVMSCLNSKNNTDCPCLEITYKVFHYTCLQKTNLDHLVLSDIEEEDEDLANESFNDVVNEEEVIGEADVNGEESQEDDQLDEQEKVFTLKLFRRNHSTLKWKSQEEFFLITHVFADHHINLYSVFLKDGCLIN